MYTANFLNKTVSAFTIDANGILTANGTLKVGGATPPTTLFVDKVDVDPSSKYLYVLDSGDTVVTGNVYAYALGTNGAITSNMTLIGGAPYPTGVNLNGSIVIDTTGKLLAVDNNGSNTVAGSISTFTINSDGSLTPITPAATRGNAPLYMTFYNAP